MLVQDDEAIAAMYGLGLRTAGYSVTHAGSGETAMALLQTAVPDVLLVDTRLPGMDGLQLLRSVRTDPDPRINGLPAVMLTNSDDEGVRQESRNLGALDYLLKWQTPPRQLVGRLDELLAPTPVIRRIQLVRTGETTWKISAQMPQGEPADQMSPARMRLIVLRGSEGPEVLAAH
jgi:CheY-like chemotaxis protein